MKVYAPNVENLTTYLKDSADGGFDKTQWYNIPHGMSSVRILPPWDPTGRVALPIYSHRIEFQPKNMKYKKYTWTCLNKTFGKPCKICEGLEELGALGVDVSPYDPFSRTFYANVIVMHDPVYAQDLAAGKAPAQCGGTAPGTHAIMRLPKTIYDWVVAQITNSMVGDITSLEKGIDVYITKEGSGLGTSYSATLSPNGRTEIPKEYLEKIDGLYDLDDIFSGGFDDETVEDLVNHLKRTSNILGSGVQSMSQQMSGIPNQQQFQQPMQQQFQQPMQQQQYQQAPQQQQMAPQQFQQPPAFGQGIPAPQQQQMQQPVQQPIQQQAQEQSTSPGNPPCFGQYNAGDIKCATCSSEVPCSQLKK